MVPSGAKWEQGPDKYSTGTPLLSGTPSIIWYQSTGWYPIYYLVSHLLSGISSTSWYTIHVWYPIPVWYPFTVWYLIPVWYISMSGTPSMSSAPSQIEVPLSRMSGPPIRSYVLSGSIHWPTSHTCSHPI